VSDELGKHTFLPWLRRGISTQIGRVDDGSASNELRSQVTVSVSVGPGPSSGEVEVPLALFGPGDVALVDGRAVVRHWPRADVFEVEPNLFPLLELVPADLPWRYTPARANPQDRLRPWLGLIVLRDDEIDTIAPATSEGRPATVTTRSGAPLPRVDQLWAWAHVHVDAADAADGPTLLGVLDGAAHRVVARLLCPRRLDQATAYTALLVPTLEHARRAALRLPIDAGIDALALAWANDGSPVELPVFYRWRFQTSLTGDFASLAQRIVARPLPPTVGSRPMEVTGPGMGLPAAASTPLAVESALRALDSQPTPWSDGDRQTWTAALGQLLNLPALRLAQPGAPRTLAPPLYGRWYAARDTLDLAKPPPWFQELNADPRLRVAAGLGTRVVQDDQPHLLAGAWAQVEGVREANAELRHAQLAREAAIRLWARHVLVRPAVSILAFTQPLHARVLAPAPAATTTSATAAATAPAATRMTVHAAVQQSPLRVGVLQPAWLRLARPLGPAARRQGRGLGGGPSMVLERINRAELRLAPPPATPSSMATPAQAGTEVAPAWLTPSLARALAVLPRPLWWLVAWLLGRIALLWLRLGGSPTAAQRLLAFATTLLELLQAGQSPAEDLGRRTALRDGTLQPAQILAAPPRRGFVAQELLPDGSMPPPTAGDQPEDTRFRQAAAAAFGDISAAPLPGPELRSINLAAVSAQLTAALDPTVTVPATIRQRLHVQPGVRWNPSDPIEPVMAAPSFPQPLYRPLSDISAEWILTGLDQLPQDTVALARTNQRFVESFMVGANHELARTLLFNEYPTDQRGSYFRQFWDASGYPPPAAGPEALLDVRPIDQWPKAAQLGHNSSRVPPPGGDFLVLVVRAELLRRYPNTVVYAVKAVWNDGARQVPAHDQVELSPDFHGSLGVGVGFWGFRLTPAQARGAPSPQQGDPGWFFALQEHSSEPRFGLEPATDAFAGTPPSWQRLAWSDLAADPAALAAIAYLDLGAPLPDTSGVTDPKHAAWHAADGARASDLAYITWREPVRLLVHAARMIPADA
jgi:hypothetical protein